MDILLLLWALIFHLIHQPLMLLLLWICWNFWNLPKTPQARRSSHPIIYKFCSESLQKKIIKNAWEELSSIPKTQNIPWCGKSWIHRQLAFRSVKRHYLLIVSLASNWAHIVICIPKCTSCPWKESFLTRKLKQRDIQLLHFLLRKIDGERGTIQ